MESPLGVCAVHWDHEPVDCAVASWTAPVLGRIWLARLHRQSASRRRAEAALWRAAKAGRLAHSKTWRGLPRSMESLFVFPHALGPRTGRARHSVRAAVWQCTNGAQGTDAPYLQVQGEIIFEFGQSSAMQ